ncbi:hypothetical protein [Luteimonas suaedae]|uniref:hypothetical protein n=1 Tax=Luteimonas suaedae TaxID=2605430 RepID=UPI0011F02594|nr:hypothetical protein [Luteimonas suaedae]
MRALFVGGVVDNSELDMEGDSPPLHYPPDTGGGRPRYRLHQVGRNNGTVAYAVYGSPELSPEQVKQVADERAYPRRFDAEPRDVEA